MLCFLIKVLLEVHYLHAVLFEGNNEAFLRLSVFLKMVNFYV